LTVAHFFLSTGGLHTTTPHDYPPIGYLVGYLPPTNPHVTLHGLLGGYYHTPYVNSPTFTPPITPPPLVCAFAVFWRFTPPIPHYLARRVCPEAVIPSKGIMSGDFNRG